jgi:hypothetical protein
MSGPPVKTVHLRPPVHAALSALALSRGHTIRDEAHEAILAYLAHWRVPIRPEQPHPGQRTLMEVFEEEGLL